MLEVGGPFRYRVDRTLGGWRPPQGLCRTELGRSSCWNPLESDLDAYSLACRVASLVNELCGNCTEPFCQQARTNSVESVTLLRRFADRYLTLLDVYCAGLEAEWFSERIQDMREAADPESEARTLAMDCASPTPVLPPRERQVDDLTGVSRVRPDTRLSPSSRKLGTEFELRDPEPGGEEQRQLQAVLTRLGHDWSLLGESVDDVHTAREIRRGCGHECSSWRKSGLRRVQ